VLLVEEALLRSESVFDIITALARYPSLLRERCSEEDCIMCSMIWLLCWCQARPVLSLRRRTWSMGRTFAPSAVAQRHFALYSEGYKNFQQAMGTLLRALRTQR
jgi:hypothetical protein